jgi:hypothetical protein
MTTYPSKNVWFSPRVDPEHILGRGFPATLSGTTLHIVDPEASTPPRLVLRSAWGLATRTSREHWSYDFRPSMFSGVQLWDDRSLAVPFAFAQLIAPELERSGCGAFVSIDEAPSLSDVMEFVFLPNEHSDDMPPDLFMAQVLLDVSPSQGDPFVVAANRILEPLFADLRRAISEADDRHVEAIEYLRAEVSTLEASLRQFHQQPTKLRAAITAGLGAIAALVLNIAASRLDPVLDRIDWPTILCSIEEVARRLGLG